MGKFKVGERYVVGGNPKPLEGFVESEIGNVIEITRVGKNHISCRTVRGESEGCVFAYDSPFAESLVPYKKLHKILITTDGKTTTARLLEGKKTIKSAKAKCSPDDEFDFKTGAKIAFQRLMGEPVVEDKPEPKLYNGKVVCIHSEGSWFTVGKIYTINNGELHDETVVNHLNIESIKDLNDRFDGKVKFIPIVE
jgi:hypothetical protein